MKRSILLITVALISWASTANAWPWISPYAYCVNNPIAIIDPDGRSVYMLFYTVGNGGDDDNMFKTAAETRMRDIMNGDVYNPNTDIAILQSVSDLGGKIGNFYQPGRRY